MQPDTDASSACSCNDTCECKNQNISSMCLVCGKDNPFSLHAQIVEHPEQDEVVCYFTPQEMHQSYPDRVHGGISAAVLDEVIGRAVQLKHPDIWGVTISLSLKYHAGHSPMEHSWNAMAAALKSRVARLRERAKS